ncbi:MAG: lanthionine synthetase LanC family protein, partial [Acidobacteriota bacterium]
VVLAGAGPWLLAQTLRFGPSTFPWMLDVDGLAGPSARLAWCHGDAGIAAALYGTACRVGRSDWRQAALDIALKAAQRSAATSRVRDAGLCHGAAGLGHLFNRLYQATRHPDLGDAARFWFEQTLTYRDEARRDETEGIGGFWALDLGDDGRPEKVSDPGFLGGAAGVALALLAATTDIEPRWDRLLLVSIPAAHAPVL